MYRTVTDTIVGLGDFVEATMVFAARLLKPWSLVTCCFIWLEVMAAYPNLGKQNMSGRTFMHNDIPCVTRKWKESVYWNNNIPLIASILKRYGISLYR